MAEAKRVLILARTPELAAAFGAAAEKLALSLKSGCEQGGDLTLDFATRDAALAVVTYAQREPFAAIVAVGDETAPVAARAASMLGLPFHTPKAADACRDKRLLARQLTSGGLSWEGRDFSRVDEPSRTLNNTVSWEGRDISRVGEPARSANDTVSWEGRDISRVNEPARSANGTVSREGHDFSRADEPARSANGTVSREGHDFSRADKRRPIDAPLGAEVSPSGPHELAVDSIMTRGRLRVLAVTERGRVLSAAALGPELTNSVTDLLRRLVPLLALKHGPVRVTFTLHATGLRLSDVSCAYGPGIDTSAMRFSIPLVDQNVSFEELVLRNALDLDTSRVLLVSAS